MSQNDLVINNQSFPATRADINSALQALGSLNSGATAPSTTYANMLWYDTATNYLKMRSEANDAWITVGLLDQSANTFSPAGVLELTQGQAEDDTSTVFGQVSGERLAQAVAANATAGGLTRYSLFTASGTFNVPADASTAMVLYTGGGAGGRKANPGSAGGNAGLGFAIFDLTPSATETITIGAGGAGFPNTTVGEGWGGAGGTTTAFGLTATGGSTSNDGTASSSTFPPDRNSLGSTYAIVTANPVSNKDIFIRLTSQGRNTSVSAAVYSEAGSNEGGIGGAAGTVVTDNDGTTITNIASGGGTGGFVAIWY